MLEPPTIPTLAAADTAALVLAPAWLPNVILYEVATKSFTSPHGPESGTFSSLRARLPYIRDLGVTAIWLTGHSLSHPNHFYNIWTQYACIDPGRLDPTLGDEADFRALIDEAHRLGLRVILDVITHGIMRDSPIIEAHPEWFKGGSWGMTDFDWDGGHADLDQWWVDIWAGYVERFGVDGFRLDVATYRWDLWQRIRRRAADAGHPIMIVTEHGPGYLGVNDFFQRGAIRLSNQTKGLLTQSPLLQDVASFIQTAAQPFSHEFRVYARTAQDDPESFPLELPVRKQAVEPHVVRDAAGEALWLEHRITLDTGGPPAPAELADVAVHDGQGQEWRLAPWVEVDCRLTLEPAGDGLRLRFVAKYPPGQWLAVQLSSHDDGWHGSALDKNPYVAQGSRCVFGYSFMLTPMIPLFMSGEEFAADFRPLPNLSPHLFGGEPIGQGRWLYGSWIDWEQLADPEHAAMLADSRRLIALRRQFSALIRPLRVGDAADHMIPAAVHASTPLPARLPVPYVYFNDHEALLVAGSLDRAGDAAVTFDVPFGRMGWPAEAALEVRDVWQHAPPRELQVAEFGTEQFTILRDGAPGGGVLVLHLVKGTE
jgi:hypothetical protein